ncbi:hypothetical protein ACFONN_16360 [Dyella humi]|uniref:Uncharacterized protein n=1 Tax=Dyella humi TaxID=1770547 RepID=A0ABW8IMY9_9GAMM
MTTKPAADTTIDKAGTSDTAGSSGSMHVPHHGSQEMADVAAHDEVLHDAALRESSLRVPR